MSKAAKKPDDKTLVVEAKKGEDEASTMSRAMITPYLRHGVLASELSKKAFGKLPGTPRFDHYGKEIKAKAKKVRDGDMDMGGNWHGAMGLWRFDCWNFGLNSMASRLLPIRYLFNTSPAGKASKPPTRAIWRGLL